MNTITQAQINRINELKNERDLADTANPQVTAANYGLDLLRKMWTEGAVDDHAARTMIEALEACPVKRATPAPADTQEAPEGMHVLGREIYKVQRSKESGRCYAKHLQQNANGKWTFVYAPGKIYHLNAGTTMDADQAAQFGALYGVCCSCGRELSDERSIHALSLIHI